VLEPDLPPSRSALFLIGHGTRSSDGVAQFETFVDTVSAARPYVHVGSGFIELVEPELQRGIDNLVDRGVTSLVGVPMVLLGAGHLKDDGPVALTKARRRHPGLHATYARALGVHPLVLSVAAERIEAASPTPGDAVIVVGRGSTDPDANADLAKAARLLADNRGLGTGLGAARPITPEGTRGSHELGLVEPAFVSLAAPDVATALERAHRLGARQITIAPYFLFAGVLIDRIKLQAVEWADLHLDTTLSFADELGVDDRLVSLVWQRYDEAIGGDAVMNCDGCIHRTPFPGYEHRVGAPPFR
jgi:sirohydrochlorin cobaltochelatase